MGRVQWVQAPGHVVDAGARDAERVHLKDLLGVGFCEGLIIV